MKVLLGEGKNNTMSEYKFYRAPAIFAEKHWDIIGTYMMNALPAFADRDESVRVSLLEAVVKEIIQVWIVIPTAPARLGDIAAIFTTYIADDGITGEKKLVVYTVTSNAGNLKPSVYVEGKNKLIAYGKAHGCTKLVTTTESDIIMEKARHLGGKIHHLAVWEI